MVFLHMPVDAALGLTDQGCELAGYGPIPAPIARDIMTNPHSLWRKVLTDPESGAVRDVGRRRYRPTQAIRDFVAVRDRECPYCQRPAQRCDYDHLHEWARLGVTSDGNGGAKCRHDHRLKDHPGWSLSYDPGTRTAAITTPAGRTYTREHDPIVDPRARSAGKPRAPSTTEVDVTERGNDPPEEDPPF